MKNLFLISLSLLVVSSFISCNDSEGYGGSATIQGKVFRVIHNDDHILTVSKPEYVWDDLNQEYVEIGKKDSLIMQTDTVPGCDIDVYIGFGNAPFDGDDVKSNLNGFYQFNYLTGGEYTIYSYSKTADGERIPEVQKVSVPKGQTASAPDIYIHDGKAYGTGIVQGKLLIDYRNKKDGSKLDKGTGEGERLYIKTKGSIVHFDEVRAGEGGVYVFKKLKPGDYEIFTTTEVPQTEVVKTTTPVSVKVELGKVVVVSDITAIKNL